MRVEARARGGTHDDKLTNNGVASLGFLNHLVSTDSAIWVTSPASSEWSGVFGEALPPKGVCGATRKQLESLKVRQNRRNTGPSAVVAGRPVATRKLL
jgi:hypothetical protein